MPLQLAYLASQGTAIVMSKLMTWLGVYYTPPVKIVLLHLIDPSYT